LIFDCLNSFIKGFGKIIVIDESVLVKKYHRENLKDRIFGCLEELQEVILKNVLL